MLQMLSIEHKATGWANGITMDIGSVGNLMSRSWAKAQSLLAYAAGYKSREKKRSTPLKISGVGEGCQLCNSDGIVPVCIKDESGETSLGTFEAPLAPGNMPALMGRVSMERQRTILDCIMHKVYFLGPGHYQENLENAMEGLLK